MACCVFTAYIMSRIIKACELFDVCLLEVKYNDSDADADSYLASGLQPALEKQGSVPLRTVPVFNHTVGQQTRTQSEPWTTLRLQVTGMTCSACVSTLTHAL